MSTTYDDSQHIVFRHALLVSRSFGSRCSTTPPFFDSEKHALQGKLNEFAVFPFRAKLLVRIVSTALFVRIEVSTNKFICVVAASKGKLLVLKSLSVVITCGNAPSFVNPLKGKTKGVVVVVGIT